MTETMTRHARWTDWEPKPIDDAERLYDVAHSRSGDKGDIVNVSVIPFDDAIYEDLVEIVTEERVADHFGDYVTGDVERYCDSNHAALNFVLHEALGGGASRTLRIDRLGKTASRHMLLLPLETADS